MVLRTTRFRTRIVYVTALLAALLCVVPVSLSFVTVMGVDRLLTDHISRAEIAAAELVAQRVWNGFVTPVTSAALLVSAALESSAGVVSAPTTGAPLAKVIGGPCAVGSMLAGSGPFSRQMVLRAANGVADDGETKVLSYPVNLSIATPSPLILGKGTLHDVCRIQTTVGGNFSNGITPLDAIIDLPDGVFLSPGANSECTTWSSVSNSTGWRVHSVCPLPRAARMSNGTSMLYVHAHSRIVVDRLLVRFADPIAVSTTGSLTSTWGWDGVAVYDVNTMALITCLVAGAVVPDPFSQQNLCLLMKSAAVQATATLLSSPAGSAAVDSSGFTLNMKLIEEASPSPSSAAPLSWVVITASGNSAAAPIIRIRGIVLVVAFCITAVTIFLLIIMLRLLTHPLRPIVESIKALTKMRLDDIGLMESSMVTEIVDIQKSCSYLAIRLYHYMRFLPDRSVLAGLTQAEDASGSSSDDDSTVAGSTTTAGVKSPLNDLETLLLRSSSNSSGGPSSSSSSSSPQRKKSLTSATRSKSKAAVNTITVDLLYESRRAGRNSPDRRFLPNKSARFVFSYKVHDPVFAKLVRACRENLKEHPGELLLVFAHTSHGLRQLVCDEDVFCAFELDAAKDPHQGPSISLTVRKGASRSFLPLAIAIGTFLSVSSRLVLCVQRLSHPSVDVQFLGLVLLCCLGMQIAQNTLIALYLIRRFATLDADFRAWLAVAQTEAIISVLCGSLNITNVTVMSCHVRLSKRLRLNAPLSNQLLEKIAKYSLVGFIIGDLLPFTFILIDVVLADKYEDPFVILSTVLSIFSVASILVQHGLRRFVMSDGLGGRGPGKQQQRSSFAAQQTRRALLLSRREVTLLRVAVTAEAQLMEFLPPPLIEVLCDNFYAAIAQHAKRFGGAIAESRGLTCAISFNAQSALLQHTATALEFFLAVHEAVETSVLLPFFTSDKFIAFLSMTYSSDPGAVFLGSPPSQMQMLFHQRLRLIGSIVSGEMAMGLAGSLNSQTLQHVGLSASLSSALCRLNEWYGSTLLTNEEAATHLDMTNSSLPVFRRIDRLQPGRCLFIPCLTNAAAVDGGLDVDETSGDGVQASPVPWQDMDPSTRKAQQAPTITVYEAVVNNFSRMGPELDRGDPLSLMPSVHQRRISRPTPVTIDAVKLFGDALELLLSLNNPTSLGKYVQAHPEDIVAGRVFRWAQFVPATNRAVAITYPRMLTALGVSQHPCEYDQGMMPLTRSDDASVVLRELGEKQAAKERLLRPSRSYRRERQGGEGNGEESAARVLERMLVADSFNVTFEKRNVTDIDPAGL